MRRNGEGELIFQTGITPARSFSGQRDLFFELLEVGDPVF